MYAGDVQRLLAALRDHRGHAAPAELAAGLASSEIRAAAMVHPAIGVRMDFAQYPGLGLEESLQFLAGEQAPEIRAVIGSDSPWAEVFRAAATDPHWSVRLMTATSALADEAHWTVLIQDRDLRVRRGMAQQIVPLPMHLLVQLTKDRAASVRDALMMTTHVAPEILEILSQDANKDLAERAVWRMTGPGPTDWEQEAALLSAQQLEEP